MNNSGKGLNYCGWHITDTKQMVAANYSVIKMDSFCLHLTLLQAKGFTYYLLLILSV